MAIKIHTNGSSYSIPEPLCGIDWLRMHLRDHTHQEIEALTLELSTGKGFHTFGASNGKGKLRDYVKLQRGA